MVKITDLDVSCAVKEADHPLVKKFEINYKLIFDAQSKRIGIARKDGKIYLFSIDPFSFREQTGFEFLEYLNRGNIADGLWHELEKTEFTPEKAIRELAERDLHCLCDVESWCDLKNFPELALRIRGKIILNA